MLRSQTELGFFQVGLALGGTETACDSRIPAAVLLAVCVLISGLFTCYEINPIKTGSDYHDNSSWSDVRVEPSSLMYSVPGLSFPLLLYLVTGSPCVSQTGLDCLISLPLSPG